MGFGVIWRKWIKICISTTMLSVLVNGSPTKSFSIAGGLRQGWHLSLLLFNLVVEVRAKIKLGFKIVSGGSPTQMVSSVPKLI
ncbi:hypothetical protein V6N12_010934 [Hibiscus sabdariffa]|uniref:Reverse transcriptase domain-containing protein n=1 Tax=Hibiscus sabdariffa TaxID=183260 RepID=A0ABR2ELJ6_9ROSI